MSDSNVEQRYLVSLAGTISGWDKPQEKLRKAFTGNEFILYAQSIVQLLPAGDRKSHFEVFVRLQEEEQQLVPPGTFLPVLEYYNLGPQLDRYVVRKLLNLFGKKSPGELGVAHLNLCSSTFADTEFCSFVGEELGRKQVPGDFLCFEFPGKEAAFPAGALALAENIKKIGCRISVGAMDDDSIAFRPIKDLRADFLKIGGGLIRNLENNQAAEAEIRTAARACRSFDVQTIAQYVESAPTLTLLRKLKIDFAQGYGISKPAPMAGTAKR